MSIAKKLGKTICLIKNLIVKTMPAELDQESQPLPQRNIRAFRVVTRSAERGVERKILYTTNDRASAMKYAAECVMSALLDAEISGEDR